MIHRPLPKRRPRGAGANGEEAEVTPLVGALGIVETIATIALVPIAYSTGHAVFGTYLVGSFVSGIIARADLTAGLAVGAGNTLFAIRGLYK